MPLNEFDVISKYFTGLGPASDLVSLDVGDDCALLDPPEGSELAISVDNLVLDRHFDAQVDAADVAYKAVAVSVSDLAAMGAKPCCMTLALTLPEADESWLQGFSSGLQDALQQYAVALIGGNLTKGPLNIATQVLGTVARGCALKRSGAQEGDVIFVSGRIGEAALGLGLHTQRLSLPHSCMDDQAYLLGRWYRPQAQVVLGQHLLAHASACIDISDGLFADLIHLLESSGVGASLQLERIPTYPKLIDIAPAMVENAEAQTKLKMNQDPALQACLNVFSAGEDYQLCFTVPPQKCDTVVRLCESLQIPVAPIGEIQRQSGLRTQYQGAQVQVDYSGFQHF